MNCQKKKYPMQRVANKQEHWSQEETGQRKQPDGRLEPRPINVRVKHKPPVGGPRSEGRAKHPEGYRGLETQKPCVPALTI